MKEINPPTKRRPQKVGPIPVRKRKSDGVIKTMFILGAIFLLIVLSQYLR